MSEQCNGCCVQIKVNESLVQTGKSLLLNRNLLFAFTEKYIIIILDELQELERLINAGGTGMRRIGCLLRPATVRVVH